MLWSIGMEVTLSVLGLADVTVPTNRHDDLLGQPASGLGRRHLVVVGSPHFGGSGPVSGALPALLQRQRVYRPADTSSTESERSLWPCCDWKNLHACYRTEVYGISRLQSPRGWMGFLWNCMETKSTALPAESSSGGTPP
jgi:hypothetical protein